MATLSQWATTVKGFSSQYSSTAYSAQQALYSPNTYQYADSATAWAPFAKDGTREYLTVGFATPVYATGVTVRESFSNGFVVSIELLDSRGGYHVVSAGSDNTPAGAPADLSRYFSTTTYAVVGVRVTIDTNRVLGEWEEIDAVQLHGVEISNPPAARPEKPVVVSPSGLGTSTTVVVKWTDHNRDVSYQLVVRDRTTNRIVVNKDGLTEKSLVRVLPDGKYRISVNARNSAGQFSGWSSPRDFQIKKLVTPRPAPPVLISATAVAGTSLTRLQWTKPSYAVRYEVLIKNRRTNEVTHKQNLVSQNVDVNLPAGSYDVQNRAYNRANQPGAWSSPKFLRIESLAGTVAGTYSGTFYPTSYFGNTFESTKTLTITIQSIQNDRIYLRWSVTPFYLSSSAGYAEDIVMDLSNSSSSRYSIDWFDADDQELEADVLPNGTLVVYKFCIKDPAGNSYAYSLISNSETPITLYKQN